ncbi:MAG: 16S rRNA (uracil(1498)-N(3))-methyltransferase [Actinomycetota bacterium]
MLTLFHVADLPTQVGAQYTLSGDDGHHAARVLRMAMGEELMLSDGHGAWSKMRVVEVGKKSIDLIVLESGFQDASATTITVIQAVTKGERSKEAIELLTEAGVDRIVPWQAARSIGKVDKGIEKMQITAGQASKQSRRFWVPEVSDVVDTQGAIAVITSADLAIVFHESATTKLSDLLLGSEPIASVVIVIGPEGGITDEELASMSGAGAKIALLGRPILRSAHAGIAAVAAVSTALRIW